MTGDDPFPEALARILRPLVRAAIARSLRFPALSDLLKDAFVTAAERHFALPGRRMTDSRISLLTGLQRKDIAGRRDRHAAQPPDGGPLPRLILRWQAPPYARDGAPLSLPRLGPVPSFETLVAEVSRDVHPRTLLDGLAEAGAVDEADGVLTLRVGAWVPGPGSPAQIGYLGANLGDHAEAAVANLLGPGAAPFFERAAHFDGLSPASLAELDRLAREAQTQALERIAAAARALQDRDAGDPRAGGRFRCGAYVFQDPGEPAP